MIGNLEQPVDWPTRADDPSWATVEGYEPGGRTAYQWGEAPGRDELGQDLLGFLTEFRAARQEQARLSRPTAGTARSDVQPPSDEEPAAEPFDPYAGSEAQVSPAWWLASDGRWYPPELHPDGQAARQSPGDAARVDDDVTVGAARPAEPAGKLRLLGSWPRIGIFHSPGTAAL